MTAAEEAAELRQTEKRAATLAAKLALAGHELRGYRNNDGQELYTVGRWGHIRHFDDLDKVETFLRTVSRQDAPKGESHA